MDTPSVPSTGHAGSDATTVTRLILLPAPDIPALAIAHLLIPSAMASVAATLTDVDLPSLPSGTPRGSSRSALQARPSVVSRAAKDGNVLIPSTIRSLVSCHGILYLCISLNLCFS